MVSVRDAGCPRWLLCTFITLINLITVHEYVLPFVSWECPLMLQDRNLQTEIGTIFYHVVEDAHGNSRLSPMHIHFPQALCLHQEWIIFSVAGDPKALLAALLPKSITYCMSLLNFMLYLNLIYFNMLFHFVYHCISLCGSMGSKSEQKNYERQTAVVYSFLQVP